MLLADRGFLGLALTSGCVSGAMFAYISGSSFVLQDVYGMSAQRFALVFGANAVGIVAAGQLSARLVDRFGPRALLRAGVYVCAGGAVLLLVAVLAGAGLPLVLPALFAVVASVGLVGPNATSLALAEHGRIAGSASAVLGVLQFVVGGVVAPLVGVAGTGTPVPMAALILALALAAVALLQTLPRATEAA